jgi:hypothetical protein
MIEKILILGNDLISISTYEKETSELLKINKKITETVKSELLEQFLNQNNQCKTSHQQIAQMFDLSYSLTNELINQEKEQEETLNKLWENSMMYNK